MGSKVHSPYADIVFCTLFYIEAVFFIPVDPILILYCIENRKQSLKYATLATLSSVAGGISGYLIGAFLWNFAGPQIIQCNYISYIISQSTFTYLKMQYVKYAHWAILVAGFTPVPYKAATLSAGFCKIPILPFIVCSLIARGARFFLFAFVILIWGKNIKIFIDRYFNVISIITIALIILAIIVIK